jgi:hypothetical protein
MSMGSTEASQRNRTWVSGVVDAARRTLDCHDHVPGCKAIAGAIERQAIIEAGKRRHCIRRTEQVKKA